MTSEVIQVDSISFKYDKKQIFDNVTFSVSSNDILIIMGLNGSGKTTLINCIMGFLKPNTGSVLLNGNNIESLNNKERARIVSYVPQDIGNNCSLSVLEYLSLGRIAYKKIYETAEESDYELVIRYAQKMNIENLLSKRMNEISGGERQLAAITKALIQETPAIIFDEPMSALDYKNQILYLKTIDELRKEGKTVLLSSHNPNHALALNANVAIIHNNTLEALGNANTVLSNDTIQKVYGEYTGIIKGLSRNYCVFDI